MSRPTAISPEEQEQIARRIGVLLLQAAPEDWQQITVEYRATGEYRDLLGEVAAQDGGTEPWEPPEELWGIFEHLREGMYRPEVGTWLSALYVVERPSSYRIDINFDAEPQWQQPLPRAAYVDELRRYPRTEDNVPDWMREKLDGSAASPQAEQQAAVPPGQQAPTPPGQQAAAEFAQSGPAEFAAAAPAQPNGHQWGASPAPSGDRFRTALVFDDFDEQGRPLVTTRTPVQQEEVGPLRHYLENAPIVLASRDNDDDLLDPNAPASVPSTWHTDGTWVWPGAVPYYLMQYGVPPQQELVEHVRARRFALGEVDDSTRDAAVRELFEQPEEPGAAPARPRQDAAEQAPARDAVQQPEQFQAASFEGAPLQPGQDPAQAMAQPEQQRVPDGSGLGEPEPDSPQLNGFESAAWDSGGLDSGALDAGVVKPAAYEPSPAAAQEDFAVQLPAPDAGPRFDRDDEADTGDLGPALRDSGPDEHLEGEPPLLTHDTGPAETAEAAAGSRHVLDAPAENEDLDETQAVLARLHDRLSELGVPSEEYRLGSHSNSARCLLRDGPDWIVTAGEDDLHGDVRFEHADQAAAFLLGSLLLSSTEPLPAEPRRAPEEAAQQAEPVAAQQVADSPPAAAEPTPMAAEPAPVVAESAPAAAGPLSAAEVPAQPAAEQLPVRDEPAEPDREPAAAETAHEPVEQPAEHPAEQSFEPFAANEPAAEPDPEQSGRPPIGDLPRRTPEQPQQRGPAPGTGGHFLFTANQDPAPEPAESGESEATRFQPMPTPGQQPAAGQPGGQQPGGSANGSAPNGFAPNAPQPGPGTPPPGLPQRAPRPEQDGRPPAGLQGTPGSAPVGGADRRPGPAGLPGMSGPPRQGPQGEPPQNRPGGPIKRPPPQNAPEPPRQPQQGQPQQGQPQGGPQQQGTQQQGGQQQPAQQQPGQEIQPLRGEPPLTLYRDRRQLVLQPGTELDRFGDPSGNVTYAAHTPYNLRSLPPQWASRPYSAYRVQRPVQVLRGTAVPWFEQPGGGTAYVTASAITDLLADGSLVELPDAQRPPME